MMWGYGWGWPGMLWMSLGGILGLVALGLLFWALVHWLNKRPLTSDRLSEQGQSPLEILRRRYARGEVDVATYERMRDKLRSPQ